MADLRMGMKYHGHSQTVGPSFFWFPSCLIKRPALLLCHETIREGCADPRAIS